MPWSYAPLWHLLIDRKMKKSTLIKYAGLNSATITKMSKDQPITMNALDKLCNTLHCELSDIVVHVPGEIRQDESSGL